MRKCWQYLITATALISCTAACNTGGAPDPMGPDASVAPPCTDVDGDGFGLGCGAGVDCDDTDPLSTNECRGCSAPDTGCACDDSVTELPCYLDPVDVDGSAMCLQGTRFCRDKAWTACLELSAFRLPGTLNGGTAAALVTGPVACNPCNPSCYSTTDTPGPADVGTGGVVYTPAPGGLTLPATVGMVGLPDTDGDGVPDIYDSQPANPLVTGFEGGFFHVLPLGATALDPLILSVRVRTADVYFLMDTTGSMGDEIANLKTSLNTTVIPAIRTTIPDAWFGVGRHDDYPIAPYGDTGSGDVVYRNLIDMTDPATGSAAITTAVNSLNLHYGYDWPESQAQALWAIATGSGLGTYAPAHACATAGRFGYPCFRPGTVPIVVLLTDAPFHNGPEPGFDYSGASFPGGSTTYTYYASPAPVAVVPGPAGPAPLSPPVAITGFSGVVPLSAPVDVPAGLVSLSAPVGASGNETYATARAAGELTTRSTSASYSGNTCGMTNNYSGSCGAGTNGDAVFSFTLAATTRVLIDTFGSGFDTSMDLRNAAFAEVGCNDDAGGTRQSQLDVTLPAGTYYVVVDGWSTNCGNYVLNLSPYITGNETYATARAAGELTTRTTSASFSGNTCGMASDYSGTCGAGSGGDAVFSFTLAAPTRVLLNTMGSDFDTSMSLRNAATAELNCNDDAGGTAQSQLDVMLAAGTYYVIVDGYSSGCGNYVLNLQPYVTSGPPNETFATAQAIGDVTSRTSSASFSGDTCVMGSDYAAGTCGAGAGGDAVFSFTLSASTHVLIDTIGSAFDTSLSLRNSATTELTCNDDAVGVQSVIDTTLAAGTYYVVVDGFGASCGAYTLNVRPYTAGSLPETYPTAQAIGDVTGRSASISGNTCGMVANYPGGCGGGASGDAVFSFTLTGAKHVVIDTTGSGYDTVLSLRNSGTAELACNNNATGVASRIETDLGAGTYYVVVGGTGAACGAYVLHVNVASATVTTGFTPPTWSQTLTQLNTNGIKVIVVESSGGDASARFDADALCTATGTVSSTGVPLRYSIASNGTGLGSTIATAIADLANYSRMDIIGRANDNPATVGFDERTFVASIAALSYPAGRCTGITGGVQFNQCLPGTTVNFQVNFTGVVAATSVAQRFDFTIDVLGNGSTILSTVPVTIIIPPIAPAYPVSGTYSRDFDATTSCTGTEVARWRGLSWSATYPVGTSISWAAAGAATAAGLATATSVSFSSPTLPSPQDIGDRLIAAGLPATLPFLRVTATLNSNAARSAAPTLSSFNMVFDCIPGV